MENSNTNNQVRRSNPLILTFLGFGAVFLATLHLRPYPLHYIIKAIPIFALAILVRTRISGRPGLLMMLGLVFSGIGDILLDLSIPIGFMIGLAAFMIAHVFYITAFYRGVGFRGFRTLTAVIFLVYGIIMIRLLLPNLGGMAAPVIAYICVITLMGISASSGTGNHILILLGASLFVFSDSIIAVNRFLTPIAHKSYWIMSTYYAGQLLMALGAIQSFGKTANEA